MKQALPVKYVLYAEDDRDDQDILRDIMPQVDAELEVVTVNNGLELIQFLDDLVPHAPTPCLVILDVNMPLWDGIQTLRALKGSERYNHLPVVMFSTSGDRKDIDLALRLGALDFVTKPVRYPDIEEVVKQFADFCNTPSLQKNSN